jgi:UDP-N-acetylglucosamine transferase subunit ALG13
VILVITGMEVHPFDRLARAVDELQGAGTLGEEFFVQLGACRYEPRHAAFERFLSFGDLAARVREASVVVTHAGAGSTLVCLHNGKHPVLVPRQSRFGEHVDEHQVAFAERFGQAGLATAVHDVADLAPAIRAARCKAAPRGDGAPATELTAWLETFWRGLPRRDLR